MANWLDATVTQLKTTGTVEALAFVEANYPILLGMGVETCAEILAQFQAGRNDLARLLVLAELEPDDINAAENQNAAELNAATAAHEKFVRDLKAVALQLAPVVIKIGVGLASGGTLL